MLAGVAGTVLGLGVAQYGADAPDGLPARADPQAGPSRAGPAPPTPESELDALRRDLDAALDSIVSLSAENQTLRDALRGSDDAFGYSEGISGGIEAQGQASAVEGSDAEERADGSDLPPFTDSGLRGILHDADIDLIRDRFSQAYVETMRLAEEASPDSGVDDAELQQLAAPLWRLVREELGPELYLSGLYAFSRPNRVSVVAVGSGASGAPTGLQPGDVLLGVGGVRVFDIAEVIARTGSHESLATRPLLVLRGGREIHVEGVQLDEGITLVEESVGPADYYAAN